MTRIAADDFIFTDGFPEAFMIDEAITNTDQSQLFMQRFESQVFLIN